MRIFITGASGFVGTAITKELVAHGHSVLGLARSDTSAIKVEASGGIPLRGDTQNLDIVRKGAAQCDVTIHCAFDHSFIDMDRACAEDRAVISAVGELYIGSDKILVISSGTLIGAHMSSFDEDTVVTPGPNPRALSELELEKYAAQGVRTATIRLPPTVHGGDTYPSQFMVMPIQAIRKHGFTAIVQGSETTWPAVHVSDAAALYRLAIERAPPKGASRYHVVADEANSITQMLTIIAKHLNVPVKTIEASEAPAIYGFFGHLMGINNPVDSKLTRERLGWRPVQPSLIESLTAGQCIDIV